MQINTNEEFFEIVDLLIDEFNESNQAALAQKLVTGKATFDGMTESWWTLLEALEDTRASCDGQVAIEQLALLDALIRSVKTILENI